MYSIEGEPSRIMMMIDRYTHIEWYHFVSVRELTMWSNCGSPRHVLYVGIWALQVGHSWLHLCKLSFMHLPQKRWLHSGLTSVPVQVSKQMTHSNSSSRNFLSDAWTEDNVSNMMRRRWRCFCGNGMCFVDWLLDLLFGLLLGCWIVSLGWFIEVSVSGLLLF